MNAVTRKGDWVKERRSMERKTEKIRDSAISDIFNSRFIKNRIKIEMLYLQRTRQIKGFENIPGNPAPRSENMR